MTLGKRLKKYRGWFAVAAVLVIAGVAIYLTRGSTQTAAAPTYTTEAAAKGTISVTVDGTGNLAVRDEVDAYPEISGTVAKVNVSEGDTVSEGDVLYTLSSTDADKTIASAKAAKQQASTSLSKAKLDLYKAKVSLSKLEDQAEEPSSTVSSSDIKIAKKEVTIASAGVDAAELELESAQDDYADAVDALDELEVTAPCDGIVWSVDISKGDTVATSGGSSSSSSASSASSSASGGTSTGTTTSSSSSGAPVTIAKDGKMGVEMTINEVDVTTLEDGQDAEVAFDAIDGLTMTGKIDGIDKEGTVSSSVVSYSVWLTLDGTDARLKSGMSATVTIVTDVARDVLLVSNSAVKTADDGTSYVQVLAQGAATPRDVTVTTGLSSSTQTEIESGLNAGDLVVTQTSTATSDSGSDSSDSGSESNQSGGIMMMGAGAPPTGGPGGQ